MANQQFSRIFRMNNYSHSMVILSEYCHSIAMQYRNIARILRHIAAIL